MFLRPMNKFPSPVIIFAAIFDGIFIGSASDVVEFSFIFDCRDSPSSILTRFMIVRTNNSMLIYVHYVAAFLVHENSPFVTPSGNSLDWFRENFDGTLEMPIKIVCFTWTLSQHCRKPAHNFRCFSRKMEKILCFSSFFLELWRKFPTPTIKRVPSLTFAVSCRKSTFSRFAVDLKAKSTLNLVWIAFKTGSGLLSDWKRDKSCFRASQTLISYRKWNINSRVGLGVCQHCETISETGPSVNLWTRGGFNWSLPQGRRKAKYFNQNFAENLDERPNVNHLRFRRKLLFSRIRSEILPDSRSHFLTRPPIIPKFHPGDIFYLLCCRINLYPSWILRLSSIVVV